MVPGAYLMIGVGVTAIVFFTLMLRWEEHAPSRSDDPVDMPPMSLFAIEFVYRLLLAATIGAIWPSIPVIVGVKKSVARRSSTSD